MKRLHRALPRLEPAFSFLTRRTAEIPRLLVWQGLRRTCAVLILAVTLLLMELNHILSALTCESNIVSRRTYYFHHFSYFEKSTEARVYQNVCLSPHSHLCSCFSGADWFISKLKEWFPFLGFFTAVGCSVVNWSCISVAFAVWVQRPRVCS